MNMAAIVRILAEEAVEIEHRVALACGGKEEQGVLRVLLHKPLDEFIADFIRGLADQRADRSDNAGAFGARLFHGLDRGFDNSSQRALPASMRRADHARVGIDEQKRSAV